MKRYIVVIVLFCAVADLFVTKTAPLLMPPIYVFVMLQSVIVTVYRFKTLHHSHEK